MILPFDRISYSFRLNTIANENKRNNNIVHHLAYAQFYSLIRNMPCGLKVFQAFAKFCNPKTDPQPALWELSISLYTTKFQQGPNVTLLPKFVKPFTFALRAPTHQYIYAEL